MMQFYDVVMMSPMNLSFSFWQFVMKDCCKYLSPVLVEALCQLRVAVRTVGLNRERTGYTGMIGKSHINPI